jgi:hypothetical protein
MRAAPRPLTGNTARSTREMKADSAETFFARFIDLDVILKRGKD